MAKRELINKAFELVKRDHGGCEDNSCDIGLALTHGYDAIAIVQWQGCGVSDEEFDQLYSGLPRSYTQKEYRRQIDEFLAAMHSVECLSCNAVCRNESETPDLCDCCLKPIKKII